ncbi:hypothetical protein CC1G_12773 [Coprinopsis cinerea okayama7|uniref:Uncharacterized protein n=1 Tax=Coprinopsis cinerea (strain Okayama-7 / 130 / ATCC MYA-4618 / FGSC 9003) TaxID=240176 RepID=A8PHS2_COPC7|nr:hypothetical protein CC1G_12773 [Coprinopsis cinerea okayama7\|eukprot:XP_001841453.2 hypothetical protein CC1G_12773 [Coprinopsis cinerea okayama7\
MAIVNADNDQISKINNASKTPRQPRQTIPRPAAQADPWTWLTSSDSHLPGGTGRCTFELPRCAVTTSSGQSFQKPDKGVPEEIAKESSQTSVGTMPDGVVSLLSVDYNPVVRTPVDDVKAVNDAAEIEDFRQSHIWNGALARYFRVPRGEGATTSSDWDKSGIPDKPLVRWADDDIQSLFPALLILRISRSQVSETSDASTAPC